jgi:non-homologous end joining protein Ku
VINAKLKGKSPKLIAEDHGPKQAEVVDLMARLRASLEGRKPAGGAKGRAGKKRAAKKKSAA